MSDKYKLQNDTWLALTVSTAQLPHAILLTGRSGIGKRGLADALAARLLCESAPDPHEPACGHCASCLMVAANSHPDFRLVQPEAATESEEGSGEKPEGNDKKKASQQIRIGQIRDIEAFFNIGSHRGGARVCLIDPAESMNTVTANSLLKILEEPTPSFYFIMVSHRWQGLLPTLVSRCRRIICPPPTAARASAWLTQHKLAGAQEWLPFYGDAPLALVAAQQRGQHKLIEALVADLMAPQDPLAHAAKWESHVKSDTGLSMDMLVTTVQKWQTDLGLVLVGALPRYFPHRHKALNSLAGRISLPLLLEAQQQVAQIRRLAQHPLNPRLFLEDLCVRAFRPLQSRP